MFSFKYKNQNILKILSNDGMCWKTLCRSPLWFDEFFDFQSFFIVVVFCYCNWECTNSNYLRSIYLQCIARSSYSTCVHTLEITRGFYISNQLFEGKNVYLRVFFLKILALCSVSTQERVMMARVRYFSANH